MREEKVTLTLPVLSGDKTGDDGRCVLGRPVLPIRERLVAEEPVPLTVKGVANCKVRVQWVRCVIGIKALHIAFTGIAVAGAVTGDEGVVDPLGIACESSL